MFSRLGHYTVIVEQQSLSRASRLLNVSQPALSRQLRALEAEVGRLLFERRGKRLELTSAGQSLYELALAEQQLERRYRQQFAQPDPVRRHAITIGASLTTLQSTLPDLITGYTALEPDTDITAVTGKTQEIVHLVKTRKADVGLVASLVDDALLHCVPLFEDHLCLVVHRDHPLAARAALSLTDVTGLPMILFSKGTWYRILTDEWFERYAVKPEIKMEIDSFEAILRLVSTCRTAALLPKSYLRPQLLEDNELVRLDLPELVKTIRTTSLIYMEAIEPDEAVERFIAQARYYYAGLTGKSS